MSPVSSAYFTGGARKLNEVAEMGHLLATGGPDKDWRRADAGMIKYWLDRMGGPNWRPPKDDDGPDLTGLTTEQLIALEKALRPLAKTRLIDVTPTSSEEVADATPMASGDDE